MIGEDREGREYDRSIQRSRKRKSITTFIICLTCKVFLEFSLYANPNIIHIPKILFIMYLDFRIVKARNGIDKLYITLTMGVAVYTK